MTTATVAWPTRRVTRRCSSGSSAGPPNASCARSTLVALAEQRHVAAPPLDDAFDAERAAGDGDCRARRRGRARPRARAARSARSTRSADERGLARRAPRAPRRASASRRSARRACRRAPRARRARRARAGRCCRARRASAPRKLLLGAIAGEREVGVEARLGRAVGDGERVRARRQLHPQRLEAVELRASRWLRACPSPPRSDEPLEARRVAVDAHRQRRRVAAARRRGSRSARRRAAPRRSAAARRACRRRARARRACRRRRRSPPTASPRKPTSSACASMLMRIGASQSAGSSPATRASPPPASRPPRSKLQCDWRRCSVAAEPREAAVRQPDVAPVGGHAQLGRGEGAAQLRLRLHGAVDGVQPRLQVAQPRQRIRGHVEVDVERAGSASRRRRRGAARRAARTPR